MVLFNEPHRVLSIHVLEMARPPAGYGSVMWRANKGINILGNNNNNKYLLLHVEPPLNELFGHHSAASRSSSSPLQRQSLPIPETLLVSPGKFATHGTGNIT